MGQVAVPVSVYVISAGKFRRYRHLSIARQLLMPSIVIPNLVDVFKTLRGVWQSFWLLGRLKPDVVFAKGGFVCLPVGIAARWRRIPVVIHDSDARPGMTNKLLASHATVIATGFPTENYSYDPAITHYTGVPIGRAFHSYSSQDQGNAKEHLGFSGDKPLVVTTGGGLGARSINRAISESANELTSAGIQILQITGKAHFDEIGAGAGKVLPGYVRVAFVDRDMANVLGAADLVVARGSATFLQELAGIGKPVIIVPAKQLSDQAKNAATYHAASAGVVMTDDQLTQPGVLRREIMRLLENSDERAQLSAALHSFAKPDAARSVAELVMAAARKQVRTS